MALLDYILPAMFQAKLTGRSVMVPGLGMAVHADGSIGTPGGGFGGVDPNNAGFGPSWLPRGAAPFVGGPGMREGFVPQQAQSAITPPYQSAISPLPIGQNFARAFPPPQAEPPALNVPQDYGNTGFGTPAFAAAVTPPAAVGGPGSREGMVPPQAQSAATRALATNAARYRATQGGGGAGGMTADQLNAASLAAARAGRTFMQPGPYPTGGNVVGNALIAPPGGPYGAPINLYAGLPGMLPAPAGTQYAMANNPLPPTY